MLVKKNDLFGWTTKVEQDFERMTAKVWFCFGLVAKNDQSILIGSRIAISAMIDINGFHLPSVDIFLCSKYHSLNAEYFLHWEEKAAFQIRENNGNNSFVFDNLTIKAAYYLSCRTT